MLVKWKRKWHWPHWTAPFEREKKILIALKVQSSIVPRARANESHADYARYRLKLSKETRAVHNPETKEKVVLTHNECNPDGVSSRDKILALDEIYLWLSLVAVKFSTIFPGNAGPFNRTDRLPIELYIIY